MKMKNLLSLAFAHSFIICSGAFSLTSIRQGSYSMTRLHASDDSKGGMATLNFKGSKVLRSDPLPLKTESLESFFRESNNKNYIRKLVLSGDGSNQVEPLSNSETIALCEEWSECAMNVGASIPDPEKNPEDDVIYKVKTGAINFPGLKVSTVAMLGTRLTFPTESILLPKVECTYIRGEQIAEGPRPLVWVFNRLTGNGKENASGGDQSVRSLSNFYTERVEGDVEKIVLVLEGKLNIAVKFPSLLLKILPVSKEKAEESGTASVTKALEKDMLPAFKNLIDFYTNL